jgi:hypothetical protein
VPASSREDGNRSSPRNAVFSSFHNTGRRTKSKNPAILIPSTGTISLFKTVTRNKVRLPIGKVELYSLQAVSGTALDPIPPHVLWVLGSIPRNNVRLAAHLSCTEVMNTSNNISASPIGTAALTTSVTSYADVCLLNQQRFEQSASVNLMFRLCDKLRRLILWPLPAFKVSIRLSSTPCWRDTQQGVATRARRAWELQSGVST